MMTDDFQLIQACLRQDKKAWDEFVDRFSRLIYDSILRTFRHYGHHQDLNAAADIHNDVFVCLLANNGQALRQYQGRNGCRLAHYMRVIAVRKTIDFLRSDRGIASLDEIQETDPAAAQAPSFAVQPDIWETLHEKDRTNMAGALMQQLSEYDRRLCTLVFIERDSPVSIAQKLGITKEHFYVCKQRLIRKLRQIAADKNFLER